MGSLSCFSTVGYQLHGNSVNDNMVCSQEVPGFILEHHFITKSFGAGCEAFHHIHPDKEVPNKTTFRLMEKFSKTGECWQ